MGLEAYLPVHAHAHMHAHVHVHNTDMHMHMHMSCSCGASASPAHGHAPLLTARQHAAPLLQHTYASGIGSVNSVTRGMRR